MFLTFIVVLRFLHGSGSFIKSRGMSVLHVDFLMRVLAFIL